MKILYLLFLIAIPTCRVDSIFISAHLFDLELTACQNGDLRMLQFTPNLGRLTLLRCESNLNSTYLAVLQELDILRLRLGNVTELPLLGNMSKLEELDLRRNRIERVANGTFHGVTNLRKLYMQENLIRELPEDVFRPLKKLEYLDLSRNQISQVSMTFLPTDSELKALYLSENPLVTLEFSFVFSPRSIDEIDLTDCREMRGKLILPFKIHTLSLEGSGVESVYAFWLIKLNAANSKLIDLNSVPHLKELNLRGTNLNFLEAGEILSVHKMLETVDLSNNSVTLIPGDDDQREWANFRTLNLSRNGLRNLPPNCPLFGVQLTLLDVSHNRLQSIDMAAFEGTYELESLFLQGNQIFNIDYRSDKLHNLKELALYDNDFDENNCTEMEGYFENNPLILHRSSRGYACREPAENKKENSSIHNFVKHLK